jgi:hypothetical protein
MSWEAIGAVGEVAGALLVGITLVYLTLQVRHSARSNRAALSWSMNQALADLNGRLSGDAELTDIWVRGCSGLANLNPIERERFGKYAMDRFNLAEFVESALDRERVASAHIDYVAFLIDTIERSPGLQELLASLEDSWVGSEALFERYRRGSPSLAARLRRGTPA